MEKGKPIYIADTLHNTIQISELEKRIISTQLFNRLHNISQNSTAYLTFPTNRTKRFEHSIGTMKLCSEMFYYGISNSKNETLFDFFIDLRKNIKKEFIDKDLEKCKSYLDDEYLDSLEEYDKYNVTGCLYNIFIPHNIGKENTFLYLATFQAVRLAALLHDIGHPPFSHITEVSINRCFNEIKEKDKKNSREKTFLDILQKYCSNSEKSGEKEKFQLHEELGNKMAEKIFENLMRNEKDNTIDIKYFNILSYHLAKYMLNEKNDFFKQLHGVIDGALDGDRLDYVSRDILNSGFESGKIEYSRLMSAMVLCKCNGEYTFAPDVKVLNTIEDFFLKRWTLYKTLIYHHRVIKTDHLLQDSIYRIIKEYLNEEKEELKLISNELVIPNDISGLWKALKVWNSTESYFNTLIQWDDGWLLSILKQYYFSENNNQNTMLSFQLKELLSNKKEFYSIIKGSNDFNKLDKIVIKNLEIDFKKLVEKGIEQGLDKTYIAQLKKIEYICKNAKSFNIGYVVSKMKLFIESFYKDIYDFNDLIEEMINDLIKKEYSDIIEEHFIEFKEPNYGLSKTPYIYNKGCVCVLDKVSNIGEILDCDGNTFPTFFLYIKKKTEQKNFEYNKFLEDLGRAIANEWNKFFESIL